jgi:hypothetical protein
VTQVPVKARCLEFASTFILYLKQQIEKWSASQKFTGNDWKYIFICMKSSSTYAAKRESLKFSEEGTGGAEEQVVLLEGAVQENKYCTNATSRDLEEARKENDGCLHYLYNHITSGS